MRCVDFEVEIPTPAIDGVLQWEIAREAWWTILCDYYQNPGSPLTIALEMRINGGSEIILSSQRRNEATCSIEVLTHSIVKSTDVFLPENSTVFALFECFQMNSSSKGMDHLTNSSSSNNESITLLSYDDRIVDILSRWEKTDKITFDILNDGGSNNPSGNNNPNNNNTTSGNPSNTLEDGSSSSANSSFYGGTSSTATTNIITSVLLGNHYFLWKVNYYFPLYQPEKDLASKKLIFHQGIHDVITGYYPHVLPDALFLAAIQLQYKYGDYVIGKEIKELRSLSLLASILSSSWFTSSTTTAAVSPANTQQQNSNNPKETR
jgi:hypothetical protein